MTDKERSILTEVEDLLYDYLINETFDMFEEIPKIDEARELVSRLLRESYDG